MRVDRVRGLARCSLWSAALALGSVALVATVTAQAEQPGRIDVTVSGAASSTRPVRIVLGADARVLGSCELEGGACAIVVSARPSVVTVHARGALHFDIENLPIAWRADGHASVDVATEIAPTSRAWDALPVALASGSLATLLGVPTCSTDGCTDALGITSAALLLLGMTAGMHMLLSAEQPEVHACAGGVIRICTESGHLMPGTVDADALRRAVPDDPRAPDDPYRYREVERTTLAPAIGLETGAGGSIPGANGPAFHAAARLGLAVHLPPVLSVVLSGESGLDVVGRTAGDILRRVPIAFAIEFVESRAIDDASRRALNFHFGGTVGVDLLSRSRCQGGACAFDRTDAGFGFSLRVGVTSSVRERNAAGLFLSWHPTLAPCPNGPGMCTTSTVLASLGWEIF